MMYYEVAQSIRDVLTWNDLKHAVLLHVGGKVPSSHVLLHYANIGQLLRKETRVAQTQSKSSLLLADDARMAAISNETRKNMDVKAK